MKKRTKYTHNRLPKRNKFRNFQLLIGNTQIIVQECH